jgi:hypothetical protein
MTGQMKIGEILPQYQNISSMPQTLGIGKPIRCVDFIWVRKI